MGSINMLPKRVESNHQQIVNVNRSICLFGLCLQMCLGVARKHLNVIWRCGMDVRYVIMCLTFICTLALRIKRKARSSL